MIPKVYLFSNTKWAIGDDFSQTQKALNNIVEFTDLKHADVVHFVWWEEILRFNLSQFIGKKIICHMSAEPNRYMKIKDFNSILKVVGLWVSQSTEARRELTDSKINNILIPYTVDTGIFRPVEEPKDLATDWKIPLDSYLISNFHRDTEGKDLKSPKLVKGPDIFLNIVNALKRKYNIHVILAGPRRFWLRNQLKEHRVNFTFVGKETSGDDISHNILSQNILNKLYNMSDLYVVSSRSEGGPRTLMESSAAKCKVISTKVGLAPDILANKCLFSTVDDACSIIEKDINYNFLNDTIESQYNNIINNHTIESVIPLFEKMYGCIDSVPIFRG